MRRSTRWKMAMGLGLATLLLAMSAAMACLATYRLIVDGRGVAHATEVLATLEGALSRIIDAENDQRGFVITGDEGFLIPYQKAVVEACQELERLDRLIADDPIQIDRRGRLGPVVARRLGQMGQAIEARRLGRADEAGLLVAVGGSRALMDQVRSIVAEMMGIERQRLSDRVTLTKFRFQVAYLTYAVLLLVILGLLWAVYRVVQADFAERAMVVEELRQSRERFEVAVAGSRDGLWDWDVARGRVYFSPQWKYMLGHDDHEISDHFDEFSSRVHPDDLERVMATIEAYLQSGLEDYELEVRLLHKDGTYRWILTRGVAFRNDRGIPYRMAGSHTDITARKDAEKLLWTQNRELENAVRCSHEAHEALMLAQSRLVQSEKLAGLGQMVAGVAHEINNPLAFVINNAAVLGRDVGDLQTLVDLYAEADDLIARDDPDLHRRIAAFRDEVDMDYLLDHIRQLLRRSDDGLKRIQQVVKDLRLFARLDEGDIKEADLNAGVESTVTIIRGNARRDDVNLVLDLSDLPLVTCYSARINQVVMNLLSNAVQACEPGGTVTVRTRPEGQGVRVEVTDTGSGIDPSIRERIFDPFFTTKPVGQGTGLGLSISYGIVQEHGGTIDVASTLGLGTTFIVRLPLIPSVKAVREPVAAR